MGFAELLSLQFLLKFNVHSLFNKMSNSFSFSQVFQFIIFLWQWINVPDDEDS